MPKLLRVSRSLRSIGRSVGKKRKGSIVNAVWKHPQLRNLILIKLGKAIKKEIEYSCSEAAESLYKSKQLEDLKSFEWTSLSSDMKRTMPTLHSILRIGLKEDSKDIIVAVIGEFW